MLVWLAAQLADWTKRNVLWAEVRTKKKWDRGLLGHYMASGVLISTEVLSGLLQCSCKRNKDTEESTEEGDGKKAIVTVEGRTEGGVLEIVGDSLQKKKQCIKTRGPSLAEAGPVIRMDDRRLHHEEEVKMEFSRAACFKHCLFDCVLVRSTFDWKKTIIQQQRAEARQEQDE